MGTKKGPECFCVGYHCVRFPTVQFACPPLRPAAVAAHDLCPTTTTAHCANHPIKLIQITFSHPPANPGPLSAPCQLCPNCCCRKWPCAQQTHQGDSIMNDVAIKHILQAFTLGWAVASGAVTIPCPPCSAPLCSTGGRAPAGMPTAHSIKTQEGCLSWSGSSSGSQSCCRTGPGSTQC